MRIPFFNSDSRVTALLLLLLIVTTAIAPTRANYLGAGDVAVTFKLALNDYTSDDDDSNPQTTLLSGNAIIAAPNGLLYATTDQGRLHKIHPDRLGVAGTTTDLPAAFTFTPDPVPGLSGQYCESAPVWVQDKDNSGDALIVYTIVNLDNSNGANSGTTIISTNEDGTVTALAPDTAPSTRLVAIHADTMALAWSITVEGMVAGTPVLGNRIEPSDEVDGKDKDAISEPYMNLYLTTNVFSQDSLRDVGRLMVYQVGLGSSWMTEPVEAATLPGSAANRAFTAPTVWQAPKNDKNVFAGDSADDTNNRDIVFIAENRNNGVDAKGKLYAILPSADYGRLGGRTAESYAFALASDLIASAVAAPVVSKGGQVFLGQQASTVVGWRNGDEDSLVSNEDGSKSWGLPSFGYTLDPNANVANTAILTPPTLSKDGKMLFVAAAGSQVVGLSFEDNSDDIQAWTDNLDSTVVSRPVYHESEDEGESLAVVYFIESVSGILRQYNAVTGDLNWAVSCGGSCGAVTADFTVSASGNFVYYADVQGNLVGVRVADFVTEAPTGAPTMIALTDRPTTVPTRGPTSKPTGVPTVIVAEDTGRPTLAPSEASLSGATSVPTVTLSTAESTSAPNLASTGAPTLASALGASDTETIVPADESEPNLTDNLFASPTASPSLRGGRDQKASPTASPTTLAQRIIAGFNSTEPIDNDRSSSSSNNNTSSSSPDSTLVMILGGVCAALLLMIVFAMCFFCRRRRRKPVSTVKIDSRDLESHGDKSQCPSTPPVTPPPVAASDATTARRDHQRPSTDHFVHPATLPTLLESTESALPNESNGSSNSKNSSGAYPSRTLLSMGLDMSNQVAADNTVHVSQDTEKAEDKEATKFDNRNTENGVRDSPSTAGLETGEESFNLPNVGIGVHSTALHLSDNELKSRQVGDDVIASQATGAPLLAHEGKSNTVSGNSESISNAAKPYLLSFGTRAAPTSFPSSSPEDQFIAGQKPFRSESTKAISQFEDERSEAAVEANKSKAKRGGSFFSFGSKKKGETETLAKNAKSTKKSEEDKAHQILKEKLDQEINRDTSNVDPEHCDSSHGSRASTAMRSLGKIEETTDDISQDGGASVGFEIGMDQSVTESEPDAAGRDLTDALSLASKDTPVHTSEDDGFVTEREISAQSSDVGYLGKMTGVVASAAASGIAKLSSKTSKSVQESKQRSVNIQAAPDAAGVASKQPSNDGEEAANAEPDSPTPTYSEPSKICGKSSQTPDNLNDSGSVDESLYFDESTIASLDLPSGESKWRELSGPITGDEELLDAIDDIPSDCPEDEVKNKLRPGSHYLSRHQAKKSAPPDAPCTPEVSSKQASDTRPMYKGVSVRPSRSRAGIFSRRQPKAAYDDTEDPPLEPQPKLKVNLRPVRNSTTTHFPKPPHISDTTIEPGPVSVAPAADVNSTEEGSSSHAPQFTSYGFYTEESGEVEVGTATAIAIDDSTTAAHKKKTKPKLKKSSNEDTPTATPTDAWSSFMNELSKVETNFFNPTMGKTGNTEDSNESESDSDSDGDPPPAPRTFLA